MAEKMTGDITEVSFYPSVVYDIISTARKYNMSIEDVARRLLSYMLEGKNEEEECEQY